MKILMIPSWFETDSKPTSGSFFKEQAIALAKLGNDVSIIYPGSLGRKDLKKTNFKVKCIEQNRIKIYRIDTPGLGNYFPRIFAQIYIAKLKIIFKKYVEENGMPDIIHAHASILGGYAATKVFGGKIPVVITEHSSAFLKNQLTELQKKYVLYALENSNAIIVVSNAMKTAITKYTHNKEIMIIPNLVDMETFKIINKKQENKDTFRFTVICNLIKPKGVDVLIGAFTNEFDHQENVELFIGGQGAEYDNLNKTILIEKREKQIKLLGQLDREEVVTYMNETDVFVLTSKFETFGVVYIEALSLGKPIIATKCGGPEDIVTDFNGILVEVDNVKQISTAMRSIYTNYKLYDKNKISEECRNTYSESKVASQIQECYEKLLEKV